jgi:Spy/CpxP family protein refolding chaperone
MKRLTHSILLAAFLTAGSLALVSAQDAPPPPPPGEGGHGPHDGVARRVDFLADKLSLTDAQKAQLTEIFTKEQEHEKKLHEETKAKVDGVLTADQKATLAALHHDHKGHGPGGPGTPPPPANP